MGWGDQGRQHQTRVSPSQSMTIPGLPHVRCASRTSFRRFPWHVRLPSKTRRESGHSGSAGLCQKRSLDHLVVACEFRRQHFEAERPLTGVRFVMDRRQFLGVRAQYPLRTARRVWRTVVLATQTPLTRVLPAPQAAATCVINSFFASINRPDARQLRPVALAQLSPHIVPQPV